MTAATRCPSSGQNRLKSLAELFPAVLPTILGSVVLIGRCTHGSVFVGEDASPPMAPNTAVIFILCGCAILLGKFKYRKTSAFLAGLCIAICGLVGAQYFTGRDLGVDQLLFRETGRVYPGRIAVTAIACFMIVCSLLLFRAVTGRMRQAGAFLCGVAGCAVISLGVVGFIAAIYNVAPLFTWGPVSPMATLTAVGFVSLGAELMRFGSLHYAEPESVLSVWVPVLVAVVSLTCTLSVWQATRVHEQLWTQRLEQAQSSRGNSTAHRNPGMTFPFGEELVPVAVALMGITAIFSAVMAVFSSNESHRRLIASETERRQLEQEVSDRLRAEEELLSSRRALAVSEENYRSIFNDSPIGIYRTTPEGRILMLNPALVRMLGYESMEEVLALNVAIADFTSDRSREEFREELEKKGVIHGLEATWQGRNGSPLYIRESARAVRDEAGRITHHDGIVANISLQKLAEKSLAHLASFPELSPIAIFETDLRGILSYLNPATAQQFPTFTQAGTSHILVKDWPAVIASFEAAPEQPVVREIVADAVILLQTLNYVPEFEKVRAYCIDITERKQAEAVNSKLLLQLQQAAGRYVF